MEILQQSVLPDIPTAGAGKIIPGSQSKKLTGSGRSVSAPSPRPALITTTKAITHVVIREIRPMAPGQDSIQPISDRTVRLLHSTPERLAFSMVLTTHADGSDKTGRPHFENLVIMSAAADEEQAGKRDGNTVLTITWHPQGNTMSWNGNDRPLDADRSLDVEVPTLVVTPVLPGTKITVRNPTNVFTGASNSGVAGQVVLFEGLARTNQDGL
ncbi:hypothetical protein ACHAQH_005174 [Verticillium albo-atrum]